jgi:hypothetical protein
MVNSITKSEDVKILVKQDIDPTDLNNALILSDKQLVSLLGVSLTNVQIDDAIYGALEAIGATFAAYCIFMGWDKEEYLDKAKLMLQNYQILVDNFRKMPLPNTLSNSNNIIVASEPFISTLNPDIPHYLSGY